MKNIIIVLLSFLTASPFCNSQDIIWSTNRPQNTIIEGCGPGEIILTNNSTMSKSVEIELSGNFQSEDISTSILSNISIAPNNTAILALAAIQDNVDESNENVIFTISTSGQEDIIIEWQIEDEIELNTLYDGSLDACPNNELILTATSNANITWMPNNVTNDSLVLFFTGQQSVSVHASQGSCMETEVINLIPQANVEINHSNDTLFLCKGDQPKRLTATSLNNTAINWQSVGFQFAQISNSEIEIMPTSSGYLYATTFSEDCTVTDTLFVQVDSLPEITIDTIPSKDPYCPGEIVTIYGMKLQQDLFPSAIYQWTPETGALTDVDKANFTVTTSDTITYIRTTTNNACVSVDSVTLNVDNPPIELNFTDTLICPNQTVEIRLENPETFEDYEWSPEDKVSCTECPNPKVTAAEPTTISLMLETEHCPTSASVSINIKPIEALTVSGDGPVCPGDDVSLTIDEEADYNSFDWSGNLDFSCSNCPNPTVSGNQTTNASVTAVDDEGCLAIGSFIYRVYPTPNIAIQIDKQEVAQGETVMASLVTNATNDFMDIVWMVNGETVQGAETMNTLTLDQEDNTIKVTALTENGCMVMATLDVKTVPPSYTIPNAFTPNGSANNFFRVLVKGNIMVQSMKVFSRWGGLVYDDLSTNGWDGKKDGKILPSDTYVYLIEMKYPDGKIEKLRGEVTLLN